MHAVNQNLHNSHMTPVRAPAPSAPPLYGLYGELGQDVELDGLHLESIADRSRLHNWEIQPHRHATLFQLLLIERGQAHVEIDSQAQRLPGPAAVWVPPFVVHGFSFTPQTRGHVVTLDQARLRKLPGPACGLREALGHVRALSLQGHPEALRTLRAGVFSLRTEYAAGHAWRSQALEGAVLVLAAAVARLPRLAEVPTAQAVRHGRAMQHLARFREQVERRFREHPTLAALAEPLGITATQLNRLCREHLRCSALDVLHQRLLLEAKRELGYTTLQVSQISDGLGFSDPAYFTRFFRRHAGVAPSRWRQGRG